MCSDGGTNKSQTDPALKTKHVAYWWVFIEIKGKALNLRRWHCHTANKAATITTASHLELLHVPTASLFTELHDSGLAVVWERQQQMTQVLGLCHSCETWLKLPLPLVSMAQPRPPRPFWGVNQRKGDLFLCVSPLSTSLIFKSTLKIVFQKRISELKSNNSQYF